MKQYMASLLTNDEYLVLDCLASATVDGETPISLQTFQKEYDLLMDVEAPVEDVLNILRLRGLAAKEMNNLWWATRQGQRCMQFDESTAQEVSVTDEQNSNQAR